MYFWCIVFAEHFLHIYRSNHRNLSDKGNALFLSSGAVTKHEFIGCKAELCVPNNIHGKVLAQIKLHFEAGCRSQHLSLWHLGPEWSWRAETAARSSLIAFSKEIPNYKPQTFRFTWCGTESGTPSQFRRCVLASTEFGAFSPYAQFWQEMACGEEECRICAQALMKASISRSRSLPRVSDGCPHLDPQLPPCNPELNEPAVGTALNLLPPPSFSSLPPNHHPEIPGCWQE